MKYDSIELGTQSKQTTPHLPSQNASSDKILDGTPIEQEIEAPINDNVIPRSKLRMFAILTALFVR